MDMLRNECECACACECENECRTTRAGTNPGDIPSSLAAARRWLSTAAMISLALRASRLLVCLPRMCRALGLEPTARSARSCMAAKAASSSISTTWARRITMRKDTNQRCTQGPVVQHDDIVSYGGHTYCGGLHLPGSCLALAAIQRDLRCLLRFLVVLREDADTFTCTKDTSTKAARQRQVRI